jgi:hypothetical protein
MLSLRLRLDRWSLSGNLFHHPTRFGGFFFWKLSTKTLDKFVDKYAVYGFGLGRIAKP